MLLLLLLLLHGPVHIHQLLLCLLLGGSPCLLLTPQEKRVRRVQQLRHVARAWWAVGPIARPSYRGCKGHIPRLRLLRLLRLLLHLPLQVLAQQHGAMGAGRRRPACRPHRLLLQQQCHRLQRRLKGAGVGAR